MFDAVVEVRQGSKGPNYGQVSVPAGSTAFIAGSPTFQLLYPDYSPVLNPPSSVSFASPVPATGYDNSPAATARVWYVLDMTGIPFETYYIGRFVDAPVISDGVARQMVFDVQIVCIP